MDHASSRPPSVTRLSKTPSWISLGFVLGVAFMWFLPEKKAEVAPEKPKPVEAPRTAVSATVLPGKPSLLAIEALFAAGESRAIWEDDRTQVAFWNTATASYSDCVEVTRRGDDYYFRDLAHLTWPLAPGAPASNDPIIYAVPPSTLRH